MINSKESDQYQKDQSINNKERERESQEREVVVLLLKEYGISLPYSKANQTKARTTENRGSLLLHT